MIQIFWVIDFWGLFLGRLILSFFLFIEFLQRIKGVVFQKFIAFLYLILSIFIFLGYYSSFVFIFLIFFEIIFILKRVLLENKNFFDLEKNFLRIALAIVFLFVGPGLLSVDRIFNIRF